MNELIIFLKERIEELEKEQNIYLEKMQSSYEEKGFFREKYFETIAKKIEVQEILIKTFSIERD